VLSGAGHSGPFDFSITLNKNNIFLYCMLWLLLFLISSDVVFVVVFVVVFC